MKQLMVTLAVAVAVQPRQSPTGVVHLQFRHLLFHHLAMMMASCLHRDADEALWTQTGSDRLPGHCRTTWAPSSMSHILRF